MDKMISVVIPTYNASRFIESAIQSVLNQTYRNFEVIIVDDCSSDDTAEKLLKYRDRIQYLRHEKNQGAAVARNTGVEKCRGEMVAFLDGDDKWVPEKLETFAEAFSRNPEALFGFSDFSRFEWADGLFFANSNSQIYPMIYEAVRDKKYLDLKYFIIPGKDMFTLLLRGYPIYPSAIVVRKKIFNMIGMWRKVRTNEDFDFGLRSCRITDFLYIDESLAMVGRHDANLTVDVQKQIEGDISVIDMHLADLTYNNEELEKIKYYRGKRLCGLGYSYLHSGDKEKSIRKYREALNNRHYFWHALVRIPYVMLVGNSEKRYNKLL
jgi:glycosyltransferase involved in cell wall biosynthesis